MHAWVEIGWLGLLATSLPLFMMAGCLRRQARQLSVTPCRPGGNGTGGRLFADAGALAAFAVPATVSVSLHVPAVAYLAAIWAAAVVRRDRSDGVEVCLPRGPSGRAALAAALSLCLLGAALGAAGSVLSAAATRNRERGQLDEALAYAELSARVTPWSLSAHMLVESLRYLRGDDPMAVGERLVELAARFPASPRPLERAARLLAQQIAGHPHADGAWTDAPSHLSQLWAATAARDPRNVSPWVELARAQLLADNRGAARAAVARALVEEPNCARALVLLAWLGAEQDEPAQTRELVLAARRADAQASAWQGHPRKVLSLDTDAERMLTDLEASLRGPDHPSTGGGGPPEETRHR
jgi:hypothetical protein